MISDQYAAGLIDGEGNIGFYSTGKGKRRRVQVEVGMTCYHTVKALHDRFGGQFRPKAKPGKPQWRWRVVDGDAQVVLRAIAPYAITKAERIDSLIIK